MSARINPSPLGGVGPQEFETDPVNDGSFLEALADADSLFETKAKTIQEQQNDSRLDRIDHPLVKEAMDTLTNNLSFKSLNRLTANEMKHAAFLNVIDPNDPKKIEQVIEAFYGKIDKLGNGSLNNSQTV